MSRATRKIAAILAADVVGYSRLMGADDEVTLVALKARRAIFDRLVVEFDGREFGSVGDSLMAQFASAVNAVRCAQAIQRAIAAANQSVAPERSMSLRIGVNLGDVIEENGALFGDGVNVAARLQSLAEPGGILVSGSVYEQVRNKVDANFTFVGTREVKNIAEPVRAYEVSDAVAAHFGQKVRAFLQRPVVQLRDDRAPGARASNVTHQGPLSQPIDIGRARGRRQRITAEPLHETGGVHEARGHQHRE